MSEAAEAAKKVYPISRVIVGNTGISDIDLIAVLRNDESFYLHCGGFHGRYTDLCKIIDALTSMKADHEAAQAVISAQDTKPKPKAKAKAKK